MRLLRWALKGCYKLNLNKLFQMQKVLDKKILERFPKLKNEDLLPKKILALQVELGELANEWRGFKFWSKNQAPRIIALKGSTMNYEYKEFYNPLLEEYVDGIHFILSIGNDLKIDIREWSIEPFKNKTILDQFSQTYQVISDLQYDPNKIDLVIVLEHFIVLGEMLGFTWLEIEQAYYEKNAINHTRQDNLY